MFSAVKAVFFDLDGTLVDSVPDLAASADIMMTQLGMPERGEARVREWVGNGVERLIHRALCDDIDGVADAKLFERARPLFMAAYEKHVCVHSKLYPGVEQGLIGLREAGVRMACVTNKSIDFARPLIEQIGIAQYFESLVGGECVANKKPAPDALLLSAQRLGVHIADSLMVGDSVSDVKAARNAGIPIIAVPYGYNHGHDIHDSNPDQVISTLAELPDILKKAA